MAQDEAGNSAQEAAAVAAVTAANWAAADALLQLELQSAAAATAVQSAILQQASRQAASMYLMRYGSLDAAVPAGQGAALMDPVLRALGEVAQLDYATPLQHYADLALVRGVDYANRFLTLPISPQSVAAPDEVADAIGGVAQSVAEVADKVRVDFEQLEIADFSQLRTAMARAAQVSNPVKQAASWTVNRASSGGILSAAVSRGARLLWVAERDACVVCLKLSGTLCDPGQGVGFDEEATFGKPGSAPSVWPPGMPLMMPPRHPHCRCHPELWYGPARDEGGPFDNAVYNNPQIAAGVDLPAALRREAKRSILRGWSLPSESAKARLDAADRLLAIGSGMPRTVEDRARRAVHNRRFTERSVPTTRRPR